MGERIKTENKARLYDNTHKDFYRCTSKIIWLWRTIAVSGTKYRLPIQMLLCTIIYRFLKTTGHWSRDVVEAMAATETPARANRRTMNIDRRGAAAKNRYYSSFRELPANTRGSRRVERTSYQKTIAHEKIICCSLRWRKFIAHARVCVCLLTMCTRRRPLTRNRGSMSPGAYYLLDNVIRCTDVATDAGGGEHRVFDGTQCMTRVNVVVGGYAKNPDFELPIKITLTQW